MKAKLRIGDIVNCKKDINVILNMGKSIKTPEFNVKDFFDKQTTTDDEPILYKYIKDNQKSDPVNIMFKMFLMMEPLFYGLQRMFQEGYVLPDLNPSDICLIQEVFVFKSKNIVLKLDRNLDVDITKIDKATLQWYPPEYYIYAIKTKKKIYPTNINILEYYTEINSFLARYLNLSNKFSSNQTIFQDLPISTINTISTLDKKYQYLILTNGFYNVFSLGMILLKMFYNTAYVVNTKYINHQIHNQFVESIVDLIIEMILFDITKRLDVYEAYNKYMNIAIPLKEYLKQIVEPNSSDAQNLQREPRPARASTTRDQNTQPTRASTREPDQDPRGSTVIHDTVKPKPRPRMPPTKRAEAPLQTERRRMSPTTRAEPTLPTERRRMAPTTRAEHPMNDLGDVKSNTYALLFQQPKPPKKSPLLKKMLRQIARPLTMAKKPQFMVKADTSAPRKSLAARVLNVFRKGDDFKPVMKEDVPPKSTFKSNPKSNAVDLAYTDLSKTKTNLRIPSTRPKKLSQPIPRAYADLLNPNTNKGKNIYDFAPPMGGTPKVGCKKNKA